MVAQTGMNWEKGVEVAEAGRGWWWVGAQEGLEPLGVGGLWGHHPPLPGT